MKKIIDLQEERNLAFKNMEAIVKKAETENRAVNEAEQVEWAKFDKQINDVDAQIKILQRQEELNIEFAARNLKKAVVTPEEKLTRSFDLFAAIRAKAAGRQLEGAELEVSQEGEKELRELGQAIDSRAINIPLSLMQPQKRAAAEIGTADGAPPIPVVPLESLSIVTTPKIIQDLGITYWPSLTGNVPIPRMGQLNAAFVSEKSAVNTSGAALAKNTLTPRRVGASDFFTKELLNQTSPAIQSQIWADFINAIWRAVQKDLLTNVAAGATVCTGRTIATAAAILAWADALLLESTIENYDGMCYVMSQGQKGLLKAKDKSSTSAAKFVWEDNMINGYKAFATASMATTNGGMTNTCFDVLFGDFKAAVVGSWGGIELIVNPYTNDDKGEVKITASGLFDTDIANALSFSVIRNATI